MVQGERHRVVRPPSEGRRRTIRLCAAGLSLVVAGLYLVLLFLVADAERGRGENTYGAYLFLSVPYVVGGVLLARLDNRLLYVLGAVVQAGVFVLFVLFGIGVLGPGVFEYEAVGRLHMAVWAVVLTSAEAGLLGLLSYLALTGPGRPVPARRTLP